MDKKDGEFRLIQAWVETRGGKSQDALWKKHDKIAYHFAWKYTKRDNPKAKTINPDALQEGRLAIIEALNFWTPPAKKERDAWVYSLRQYVWKSVEGKVKQYFGDKWKHDNRRGERAKQMKEKDWQEFLGENLAQSRSKSNTPVLDAVEGSFLKEKLQALCDGLPDRERRVIAMRYGLYDGKQYTLKEVGQKMAKEEGRGRPYTRERVRQIEEEALKKLFRPAQRQGLDDFKKTT